MGDATHPTRSIQVQDEGSAVSFSFEEMLRFSGPGSPGGVALGFKVLERALPLLEPDGLVERREVVVETAFRGPGVRDACELVTRALTDGRYLVDPALERPERGHTLQTFAFRLGYCGRTVPMLLRPGLVTDEFVRLAQTPDLTTTELDRFTAMKQALADRLVALPAAEVLDLG